MNLISVATAFYCAHSDLFCLSVFFVMRKTKCNLTTMEVSTVDSIECRQDVLSRKKKNLEKKLKKKLPNYIYLQNKGFKSEGLFISELPRIVISSLFFNLFLLPFRYCKLYKIFVIIKKTLIKIYVH